jgi:death-on-curing protein
LDEFLYIAERVLPLDAETLAEWARLNLADSALHAPAAGFGDEDFYPDLTDKAAVLCARLAWNHALPDGNKRTAWATMRVFVALNGGTLSDLDPDDVVMAMVSLAAHNITEDDFADWLRDKITWP